MSASTTANVAAITPLAALLKAYAYNIRAEGLVANQVTEEISQIGESHFPNWYDDLEDWLEDNPDERGAPIMKLVGAWAAFKRAGSQDDKAKETAASIWETGERLVQCCEDSVHAWVKANPSLAPV